MEFVRMKRLIEKGYEALASCVLEALEEEEPELAVICGLPLVELANAEKGSYVIESWYNEAMELGRRALELARREGVPSWLRDDVEKIWEILRESGWGRLTGF